MGVIVGFIIGFLAGFFANWGFGMVMRLLPATLVRFKVETGNVEREEGLGNIKTWSVMVTISQPGWRVALKEPLREYLIVEVRFGEGKWIQSMWNEGDPGLYRLRADAAMTVPAVILTGRSNQLFLGHRFLEEKYALPQGQRHLVEVRIVRTLDKSIAAVSQIQVSDSGDVEL